MILLLNYERKEELKKLKKQLKNGKIIILNYLIYSKLTLLFCYNSALAEERARQKEQAKKEEEARQAELQRQAELEKQRLLEEEVSVSICTAV